MAPRHHRRGFWPCASQPRWQPPIRSFRAGCTPSGRWQRRRAGKAASTLSTPWRVRSFSSNCRARRRHHRRSGGGLLWQYTAACKTRDTSSDAALRACGLSAAKLLAARDLCRRQLAGELPSARQMAWMEDEAIIQTLMPVRGIGRWTAQMLRLFTLGRADVLPLDDLGVARGLQRVDGQQQLPLAAALAARGQCWSRWRSAAALALWRIADADSAVVDACRPR